MRDDSLNGHQVRMHVAGLDVFAAALGEVARLAGVMAWYLGAALRPTPDDRRAGEAQGMTVLNLAARSALAGDAVPMSFHRVLDLYESCYGTVICSHCMGPVTIACFAEGGCPNDAMSRTALQLAAAAAWLLGYHRGRVVRGWRAQVVLAFFREG